MGRAHASDFLSRASAGGATAQAVSRQQERTIAPASLDKVIGISVSLEASAATHAVLEAAKAVDLVHAIVGASGIREEQPFSKHFRDVHVITQHGFVNASKLESFGQIRLGLPPEWPFFAL